VCAHADHRTAGLDRWPFRVQVRVSGRKLGEHDHWGEYDVMLRGECLRRPVALSLTYTQVLWLGQEALETLAADFPACFRYFRHYCLWHAVRFHVVRLLRVHKRRCAITIQAAWRAKRARAVVHGRDAHQRATGVVRNTAHLVLPPGYVQQRLKQCPTRQHRHLRPLRAGSRSRSLVRRGSSLHFSEDSTASVDSAASVGHTSGGDEEAFERGEASGWQKSRHEEVAGIGAEVAHVRDEMRSGHTQLCQRVDVLGELLRAVHANLEQLMSDRAARTPMPPPISKEHMPPTAGEAVGACSPSGCGRSGVVRQRVKKSRAGGSRLFGQRHSSYEVVAKEPSHSLFL